MDLKYPMNMHSELLDGSHLRFVSSFSTKFRDDFVEPVPDTKPGSMRLVKTGAIGMCFCRFPLVVPSRIIFLERITGFFGIGLQSCEVRVDVFLINPIPIQTLNRRYFDKIRRVSVCKMNLAREPDNFPPHFHRLPLLRRNA